MKLTRTLFLLSFVVFSSIYSFGQTKIAHISSSDNLASENKKGLYQFTLPEGVTAKEVALSSEYYTLYFSVAFTEENHQAVITMKDSDDRSKHIICRFLVSLGVEEVQFNAAKYPVEDFYQKFIKTQGK